MVKFFTKKLNKKGFTLAELLIVVAIIAVLIAIAVPIYTSALKDAQIKVNLSNARTLKGAAVSYILSHWTEADGAEKNSGGAGAATSYKYSDGANNDTALAKHGWLAIATFDENGDISEMKVGVLAGTAPTSKYYVNKTGKTATEIEDLLTGGADVPSSGVWEAISSADGTGATANKNTIIAYITDAEVNKVA